MKVAGSHQNVWIHHEVSLASANKAKQTVFVLVRPSDRPKDLKKCFQTEPFTRSLWCISQGNGIVWSYFIAWFWCCLSSVNGIYSYNLLHLNSHFSNLHPHALSVVLLKTAYCVEITVMLMWFGTYSVTVDQFFKEEANSYAYQRAHYVAMWHHNNGG